MKTKEEIFEYFDAHGFNEFSGFLLGYDVGMLYSCATPEEAEDQLSMYNEAIKEYVNKNNISKKELDKFCSEYGYELEK